MTQHNIKCCMCGLRKAHTEFSKNARKDEDPACMRCTAWTETQEPGIIPVPLETGHVSIEEAERNILKQKFRTAEDYDDNELKPPPPAGQSYVSRDEQEHDVQDVGASDTHSIVASQTSASIGRQLPSHLQRASATPSIASERPTPSTVSRGLPPHLAAGASSISTATTVRNDREARDQARQVPYTEYRPDGGRVERTVPRTATSTTFSETSRGQTSGVGGSGAPPPRVPRPERQQDVDQIDQNLVNRIAYETRRQRTIGFANDDSDFSDDG